MLAEAKHIGEDNSHMVHHDEAIIGRSAALHEIMDQVGSVAPTNATVLLYGETGTGKELIARAVILSPGPVLYLSQEGLPRSCAIGSPIRGRTLGEVEREHILHVLRETKGVIGGSCGAAAQLGMRRTTLPYRIEKLGIPRQPV